MARGTLLSTLVSRLKAEIGDYSGTNTARDAELRVLLSNKQDQLELEFSWSFLKRRWDKVIPAGTRLVTFPTVDADLGETAIINLDEIDKVEVLWNSNYYPLQYGIGIDEYNSLNPSLGQGSDPILRWRETSNPDEATGANQFEVWPQPVTQQTVRFSGSRELLTLAADTDKADLDDTLLVLGVAVDILTRTKQPDAQIKAQYLTRHLRRLGMRNPVRETKRVLGQGRSQDRGSNVKLIAIH